MKYIQNRTNWCWVAACKVAGKLSDGTTVVARPGSTTGGATLEIRVSNRKVYKIRY